MDIIDYHLHFLNYLRLLQAVWSWVASLPWGTTVWFWSARIAKALGYVVAALWVYFNFVKSRTYYPRMELTCSGTMIPLKSDTDARRLFVPRLTLKHIGKALITLEHGRSGYTLLFSDGVSPGAARVKWETDGKWYNVFQNHYWIEPEEVIFHESEAFVIPSWAVAVKLEGRVVGTVRPLIRRKAIRWTNSVVIDCTGSNKQESIHATKQNA